MSRDTDGWKWSGEPWMCRDTDGLEMVGGTRGILDCQVVTLTKQTFIYTSKLR